MEEERDGEREMDYLSLSLHPGSARFNLLRRRARQHLGHVALQLLGQP